MWTMDNLSAVQIYDFHVFTIIYSYQFLKYMANYGHFMRLLLIHDQPMHSD